MSNVRTDDAKAVDVLGTAAQVLATAKKVFDRDRLSVRLVQTLVAVALYDEMPLFDIAARLGGNVSTTHADLQHLGRSTPEASLAAVSSHSAVIRSIRYRTSTSLPRRAAAHYPLLSRP